MIPHHVLGNVSLQFCIFQVEWPSRDAPARLRPLPLARPLSQVRDGQYPLLLVRRLPFVHQHRHPPSPPPPTTRSAGAVASPWLWVSRPRQPAATLTQTPVASASLGRVLQRGLRSKTPRVLTRARCPARCRCVPWRCTGGGVASISPFGPHLGVNDVCGARVL